MISDLDDTIKVLLTNKASPGSELAGRVIFVSNKVNSAKMETACKTTLTMA